MLDIVVQFDVKLEKLDIKTFFLHMVLDVDIEHGK